MRRTRKQWAELRNEQRCLAECRELVDEGLAFWLEPQFGLLSAEEALAGVCPRWVAEPMQPELMQPLQLRLEVA